MDLGLTGKCAIVCAASKGLGRASALALAREGASIVMCARRADALEQAAREIRAETGAAVLAVPADVGVQADADRLIRTAVDSLGGIDVLVTNTGGPPSGPFEGIQDADWYAAIESLLMSVVRLSRGVIPHMRARGGGRIIHITSISVKQPVQGLVLSNALRAAVTGLSKTLSNELATDRHPRELRGSGIYRDRPRGGVDGSSGAAGGRRARDRAEADRGKDSDAADGHA